MKKLMALLESKTVSIILAIIAVMTVIRLFTRGLSPSFLLNLIDFIFLWTAAVTLPKKLMDEQE